MDIVVRTPHGDADVSIISQADATTLGELVDAVTGQAVPRLVLVDDRPVDAATPLVAAGLLMGSVLTTEPARPTTSSAAEVALVQIAGHGAGRSIPLEPGRYRIGPGRRSHARELDIAPVDHTAFELIVEPARASPWVTVVPDTSGDVRVDGVRLDSAQPWRLGTLTAHSRAFQLDVPVPDGSRAELPAADGDGMVRFNRPPRAPSSADRRPVADAFLSATTASPDLWERRPDHADAFVLPVGVNVAAGSTVELDLRSERAVAVVGPERFASALVRTILVEATTLHGPADLELVVLSSPDRLAAWDWAKWLPHLRLSGSPAIWSSGTDIGRWVRELGERPHPVDASPTPRLTLVVLDDPGLWADRASPLRPVLSAPPDDVRFVAVCDAPTRAPSICTASIIVGENGSAQVQSFARPVVDTVEMLPASTEADVAAAIALGLAPLTDVEVAVRPPPAPAEPVDLAELVGAAAPEDVLARWSTDARPAVAIGRRDRRPVELPIVDDVTVFVSTSIVDAFDVAATFLLAQCADRSPDALWIVPLVSPSSPRFDLLSSLPHVSDPADGTIEPARVLERLRSLLADPTGPDRVVITVEAASAEAASIDDHTLLELATGVRGAPGLAMVVITDRAEMAGLADTATRVERRPGTTASPDARAAIVESADGTGAEWFSPLQPASTAADELELRPFVIGRARTPLERRVERRDARSAAAANPAVDRLVAAIEAAASQRRAGDVQRAARVAFAPPLTTHVELEDLFATAPGDGVPLGLVDDPGSAGTRTFWWEPGTGSLLLFGSRRSGIINALAAVVLGVIDRFADHDVRLLAVESSPSRRRALDLVDREIRTIAPERADEVAAALDEIAGEVGAGHDDRTSVPRLVVVIDDLVLLRRQLAGRPLGQRLDDVLVAAAPSDSGVDVIAYASELEGAGPFATAVGRGLVGASSDPTEAPVFGVEHTDDLDIAVGRCRSFPGAELVQIATTDTPMEELLARRAGGDPG